MKIFMEEALCGIGMEICLMENGRKGSIEDRGY